MKRVPKVGDTVFMVDLRQRSDPPKQKKVLEVGRIYFYTDIYKEEAFQLISFCDGAWSSKYCSWRDTRHYKAFVSEEAYNSMRLKNKRIAEIKKYDFNNCSCAEIERIHADIFATPDGSNFAEWER
jgi:hypothetical protein